MTRASASEQGGPEPRGDGPGTDLAAIDLRFVLPAANENRWSDLLASLICTDPRPMSQIIGKQIDGVRREVAVRAAASSSDRLDILLTRGDQQVAVIEVKLMSDLGPRQLSRYESSFPDAGAYLVLHLSHFPVSIHAGSTWSSLTWERVLDAYADSDHPWVATTARAWRDQLDRLGVPADADTVWNDVPDGHADAGLALRARVAWLAQRLDVWCDLDHDLLQSTGGGNWVLRMWIPARRDGYVITAELQEGLSAAGWRADSSRAFRDRLIGPVILLGLRQDGVDTSKHFNWRFLHRLFLGRVIGDDGQVIDGRAWQTTKAQPKHPADRAGWQLIVDDGAPPWLGKGYGMSSATKHGSCIFGARYELDAAATLAEVEHELMRVQMLLRELASVTTT